MFKKPYRTICVRVLACIMAWFLAGDEADNFTFGFCNGQIVDVSTEARAFQAPESGDQVRFLALFSRPEFLDELELTADQRTQIEEALAEWKSVKKDVIDKSTSLNEPIDTQRLVDAQDNAYAGIANTLLPHQLELIAQFAARMNFNHADGQRFPTYVIRRMATQLELSQSQTDQLSAVFDEGSESLGQVAESFSGEVNKIFGEEKDSVIGVLSEGQADSVRAAIGDEYEGVLLGAAVSVLRTFNEEIPSGTIETDSRESEIAQARRVLFNIAFNQNVLGDLEPTDEQLNGIEKIKLDRMKFRSSIEFESLPPKERNRELEENDLSLQKAFLDSLLPMQRTRVEQLTTRMDMAICGGSLAEYLLRFQDEKLDLSESQKASLDSMRSARNKLLNERVDKYLNEVSEILTSEKSKVVEILEPDQRERLNTELGDAYDEDGFHQAALRAVGEFLRRKTEKSDTPRRR